MEFAHATEVHYDPVSIVPHLRRLMSFRAPRLSGSGTVLAIFHRVADGGWRNPKSSLRQTLRVMRLGL
jgi:hypothetical protein